ncbi:ead/Ea22-like family protein [Salmonella enterica subsp. enterica serovar Napoli]|uniref:Ead/Ea22-like family protein n=1 Tax=Salmonella enterica subsp. enterica serovar Napoli TaxID=1151001 RepID=A0A727HRG7_SALET|nr:ead/Ea22-like family protein [Salmonella enterica subsp. enterica serovar Napoli]HAE1855139.1 ead/Ea22-like family protein [Salmonella enterica subsp. enterica serovar Napoli]HAK8309845.1 ead/Ea22-like family protein [Salmonella enterica]
MSNIDKQALLVSKAKVSVFTMGYISQFEASDIDSDDIDLRFEVDGVETGTTVSIVDECGHAAQIITALLDELEHYKSREERVTKLVLDNSTSWDALYKKLEAAEKRIAEQREYYEGVIADGSKRIAELERSETQLINERDSAESALNDAYKAVMGQAPEWSNWFSFENAIDEIELACEQWRNQTDDVIQFRQRIQELEAKLANPVLLPKTNGYWNEQEKAYEEAITLAKQRIRMAGFRCEGDE